MRLAALAAILLAALAVACGGDSNGSESAATPAGTATAGPLAAAALVPKLDDLGYQLTQQGKEPAIIGDVDSALALYQKQGSPKSVQVRVYVFPDAGNAEKQWAAYAEAFRNPPPDVLGTSAKNVDATSPQVAQLRKSYVTAKPDGSGNNVWTDIYRQGRVVALVQVLDSASGDGMAVRKPVAERIFARAP